MRFRSLVVSLLSALPSLVSAQRAPAATAPAAKAAAFDTAFLKVPTWRFVGPDGNRVIAVTGVPGEYKTYYAGAASGGLFKSTNGGIRWVPITDSLRVSSVSAIAVAPSDPNVVWFGTGETFLFHSLTENQIVVSTDVVELLERVGRGEATEYELLTVIASHAHDLVGEYPAQQIFGVRKAQ